MKAYRHLSISLVGMTIIIVIGATGYTVLEGLGYFDALWMTVITLLTVGYGDFIPKTVPGRTFTLLIIPLGIGFATYTLGAIVAAIIEAVFSEEARRKRMERSIQKLNQHVIVCGYGRVGQQVADQLQKEAENVVVIDANKDLVNEYTTKHLMVEGNATEDAVLKMAGIERAAGLVAALPDDADNVFISLTARGLNPELQIVARAERAESEDKLIRAGANKVINPSSIGGRRMAMSILKPASVDYIDTLLLGTKESYGVEEISIRESSVLQNKTIQALNVREDFAVTIIAIKRGTELISTPSAHEILQANDVIVVFGTKAALQSFEAHTK